MLRAGSDEPVIDATVQLWDSTGSLIESMTTDDNGWYLSEYFHKGKEAEYTLVLVAEPVPSQTVTVGKAVKFGEVNFTVP